LPGSGRTSRREGGRRPCPTGTDRSGTAKRNFATAARDSALMRSLVMVRAEFRGGPVGTARRSCTAGGRHSPVTRLNCTVPACDETRFVPYCSSAAAASRTRRPPRAAARSFSPARPRSPRRRASASPMTPVIASS
jgi:hypothetical protein